MQAGAIEKRILLFAAPRGLQVFASRTEIAVVLGVKGETGTPAGAVIPLRLIPYGDVLILEGTLQMIQTKLG